MSEQARQPAPTSASWLSTLGWAAYLACSWTWCIGMFLPVLLVRDYGIWGFVVFAVPNVVGAGAMGWVLRDGVSEHITKKHARAVRFFSHVTIVFQGLFAILLWVHFSKFLPSQIASYIGPLFLIAGVLLVRAPRLGATVLWILSVGLIAFAFQGGMPAVPTDPQRPPLALIWLAPICLFGFLLCPYLDVTFHKSRQSMTARDSRAAFGIGFGMLFTCMIVGTVLYTGVALGLLEGTMAKPFPVAVWLIGAHVFSQLAYTIFLHWRDLRLAWPQARLDNELATTAVSCLIGAIILNGIYDDRARGSLDHLEVVYRCFMSFYGLVFPAYVWLCMIPTPDGHSGLDGPQGKRKLIVLIAAVALAAPCFWMGFIERVEWWLAPGLGIVLLSRLLVRSMPNRRQLEN